MFCINCGKQLPKDAKFCSECGSKVTNTDNFDIFDNYAEKYAGLYDDEEDYKEPEEKINPSNAGLTLAKFRQNAPVMAGHREELLAFRKSLSNSWDYNAYVGILLGVGGSKHGDAACMNFAIGQGDNGNNVKKTLEAKGLMSLFEKYKGKKIDSSILLSDVENEILSIAPEYAPISQRLSGVLYGKSNGISTPVQVPVKPAKTVQTVSKAKTVVAEPKKVKPVSVEETMLEKYKKLPCHEVAYSFPAIFKISGEIHRIWKTREYYNMVQEYEGDLYYAEYDQQNWTITCCRCNMHQNGKVERIARFSSEEYYAKNSSPNFGSVYKKVEICRAGAMHRTFCVYDDRIYYSACQMSANCSDTLSKDNSIWSMDLFGNDKRKEVQLDSKASALFCPYVTAKAFVFDEGYWIDRQTHEKKWIKKGKKIQYLSINEIELVAMDNEDNVFAYDFSTEKRTPIEKIYKKAKEKDIVYVDGKHDILYYFEQQSNLNRHDVFGKIIGITKDGTMVDSWETVKNHSNKCVRVNGELHFNSCEDECSAVLFNGQRRIYKSSCEYLNETVCGDSIFSAEKDGTMQQIYKKQWNAADNLEKYNGRSICSVIQMLTSNFFISHLDMSGKFETKKGIEKAFPLESKQKYVSLFD